jgi:hypothetical protein
MGNSKSKSNSHVQKLTIEINKQCGIFYFNAEALLNQLLITKGKEHIDMFITVDKINLSIRKIEDIHDICKVYNYCDKMILNVTINETEEIYDCMIYYLDDSKKDHKFTAMNSHGHVYYPPVFKF